MSHETSAPERAGEAPIRALFDHMKTQWNRHDARAYASVFGETSDYVTFDGRRLRGRAANAALHDDLFRTVLAGSRLVGDVTSVRFVTPDVAILHTEGTVLLAWQRRPNPSRLSRQTLVAVRRDGDWQIEAFHNTRVQKGPGPMGVRVFSWMVAAYRRLFGGAGGMSNLVRRSVQLDTLGQHTAAVPRCRAFYCYCGSGRTVTSLIG